MRAQRASRRLAASAGFALAVALLFWGMAALSSWITRAQLARDAHVAFTALREDQPLWRWTLRRHGDLVAGRAFGAVDLTEDGQGLRVTSRDGTAVELGLPLAVPIDLAHWPQLRLDLHSTGPGTLGVIYQASESSPACRADEAAAIATGDSHPLIDLRALSWRTSTGVTCPPPGVVSYMLRIRPQLPSGASLRIDEVVLLAIDSQLPRPQVEADAADIQLPADTPASTRSAPSAPVVRLPADASAETMLTLRDWARQQWPAALVLPFGLSLPAAGGYGLPPWLDWLLAGLYLGALVWVSYRQTREIRHPWVEVAAIAGGPLWLIAGLRWGEQASIPGVIAFVAALTYGGVSEWRRRPVAWTWLARHRSDWLWPMVPLPVAAALVLIDGHGLTRLPAIHVAAYFGWALLQQWSMLAIVMGRLRHTRLPEPGIVLVTAALFGLLHTPNGSLMELCFMAELWWAWRFLKAPRLLPIAVAHAICALLVESGLTGHLLRSLQVSARFFL